MEKRIIKKIEIVLEEYEARMVMHCLDYCWHRLSKHKEKDIGLLERVRPHQVDTLRRKLIAEFDPNNLTI